MATLDVKVTIVVITVLALWSDRGAALGPMKHVTKDATDDKRDFTVEIKKVDMDKISSSMFGEDTFLAASLYNETKMVLNALLNLKEDLVPNKVKITMVGNHMDEMTNKWIAKFRQTHDLCHFIDNNSYMKKELNKFSNFPTKCPVTKGEYYLKDMVINSSESPKQMEESKWRVDVNIFDQATNEPLFKFSVYANIEAIDDD